MKKETITSKSITIIVSGKNEKDINEALDKSFETVLTRVKSGKYYMQRSKKIGQARLVNFGVAETARHI